MTVMKVKTVNKKPASMAKVWSGAGKPPLSFVGDGPVDYKGGRIYKDNNKKMWRIIRERGVYKTECQCTWKGGTPDKASWEGALRKMDIYKPAKK